jgi:hypothetical protein
LLCVFRHVGDVNIPQVFQLLFQTGDLFPKSSRYYGVFYSVSEIICMLRTESRPLIKLCNRNMYLPTGNYKTLEKLNIYELINFSVLLNLVDYMQSKDI